MSHPFLVLAADAPGNRTAGHLHNIAFRIRMVNTETPPGPLYGSPEADERWRQYKADRDERLRA